MERTAEVEHLSDEGCSVLCLDCPQGILFGIDYSAWAVGPLFMGVKLVPPGLHFVYCSPGSSDDIGVARTGFFLFMRARDVAVFRWDPGTEELVRLENQDEEARYSDGVRGFDFDSNLGPYPLQLSPEWAELTRHASPGLVAKIEPVAQAVRSKRAEYDSRGVENSSMGHMADDGVDDCEMEEGEDVQEPAQSEAQRQPPPDGQAQQEQQGTTELQSEERQQAQEPQMESNEGSGNLFFSTVPRVRRAKGATPAATTLLHMDRSAQLEEMITKEYKGNQYGILGELQLAYIAFLLGQNYDGFAQWRQLLLLLCSCETAVSTRPELFVELCRAFFAQLSQAPPDLFGDDITRSNFLGSCAVSLLEICDTEGAPPKLRKRCGRVRELVLQKFGLSTEDLALLGEDAPQIVEADGTDLVDLGCNLAMLD